MLRIHFASDFLATYLGKFVKKLRPEDRDVKHALVIGDDQVGRVRPLAEQPREALRDIEEERDEPDGDEERDGEQPVAKTSHPSNIPNAEHQRKEARPGCYRPRRSRRNAS